MQRVEPSIRSRLLLGAEILALAALYFGCGKFGLSLAFLNASASAVWPPSGLALAALLVGGRRLWPGVWLGAFLVNITTPVSLATALGIATGNTLEAVLGAWLVEGFARGLKAFERARSIFEFVFLAAILSTSVSATVGVTSLCLGGFAAWDQYLAVWLTWWLGDMVSDLVIAPLLVTWLAKPLPRLKPFRILEGAGLLLLVVLAGGVVFLEKTPFTTRNQPLEYLAIPPLLWAAFRFGRRGAVACAFVLSGIALWGTRHGLGPFARPDPNESLLLLQTFVGTITLMALVLALVVAERQRAQQRLHVQDAVSRALAEAPTLRDAVPRIFQALCEKGGWELGAIWNADPAANELFCLEVWHLPSVPVTEFEAQTKQIRLAPGQGLPGRVWQSGGLAWVSDVTAEADSQRTEAARKAGLHAGVCFPLRVGHDILGVMECFSRQVREPDEDFLQMLGAIGSQVGQFIERKQAEQHTAHLAAVVESSNDAIISKTLDGIITSWNQGAARIFGYRAEEVIGQPITILIPPEYAAQELEIMESIRRGQGIDHHQTVRRRKDGSLIDVSLTVSPVKDADGRIVGASKIARDITEQRQTGQALAEAQEELRQYAAELERRVQERTARLQESVQSLNAFCYSIAHDLRAPLRAMIGFSGEVMEQYAGVLDEVGRDYLSRIKTAASRMDQLTRDLLELGRLNTLELRLERLELEPMIRKALAPLEPEIQKTAAQVRLQQPLLPVRASAVVLEQVLVNLLDNALKFVPPSAPPQVKIWTEARAGMVRVCVRDNGIGIKPEYVSKLFQPFVRLVNGQEYPGTGIGLAIVSKGVERMHGRAGVDSAPGQGSCFWIELPEP